MLTTLLQNVNIVSIFLPQQSRHIFRPSFPSAGEWPLPSKQRRMCRIGIFGGTFNPIHFGHLRLAQDVAQKTGLDKIIFIPNNLPPHRATPNVSAHNRYSMVELAIANNPLFALSDIELRSERPSYTFQTITELAKELSQSRLSFISGVDSVTRSKWRRFDDLLSILESFYVVNRPGYCLSELESAIVRMKLNNATKLAVVETDPLDISSSRLREALAQGHSIRYLTPDPVIEYISSHGLYTQQ